MNITISLKWENVSPDSPEGKAIYSIEPGATWFELRLPSIKRACEVQEMAQFLLDEGQRIGRNKALQQMRQVLDSAQHSLTKNSRASPSL